MKKIFKIIVISFLILNSSFNTNFSKADSLINQLPDELLFQVFNFLKKSDLLAAYQVNQNFRLISKKIIKKWPVSLQGGRLDFQKCQALFNSNGSLNSVAWLSLYFREIDPECIKILPLTLKNLKIRLKSPKNGDDLVNSLVTRAFPNLQHLNLSMNNITELGAKKLASHDFPKLLSLDLSFNKLKDNGLFALAAIYSQQLNSKAGFLSQLQFLNLKNNEIKPDGIRALTKLHFEKLLSLDISQNQIGNGGLKSMALASSHFPVLEILKLGKNSIDAHGAREFARGSFERLRILDLTSNSLGDAGAFEISQLKSNSLQSLVLTKNGIGSSGASSLSRAQFPQLQTVNLGFNEIEDLGMIAFSQANFPKLESFNVIFNRISDPGAMAVTAFKFPNLKSLNLFGNEIGIQGASAIARAEFPHLKALNLERNIFAYSKNRTIKKLKHLLKKKFKELDSLVM